MVSDWGGLAELEPTAQLSVTRRREDLIAPGICLQVSMQVVDGRCSLHQIRPASTNADKVLNLGGKTIGAACKLNGSSSSQGTRKTAVMGDPIIFIMAVTSDSTKGSWQFDIPKSALGLQTLCLLQMLSWVENVSNSAPNKPPGSREFLLAVGGCEPRFVCHIEISKDSRPIAARVSECNAACTARLLPLEPVVPLESFVNYFMIEVLMLWLTKSP